MEIKCNEHRTLFSAILDSHEPKFSKKLLLLSDMMKDDDIRTSRNFTVLNK